MIQIFLVDGQTDGWNDGPREPNSRKIKKECVAVMLNLVDMNSICPGALRKLIQLFEGKNNQAPHFYRHLTLEKLSSVLI